MLDGISSDAIKNESTISDETRANEQTEFNDTKVATETETEAKPYLFSNTVEKHQPNDTATNVSVYSWDSKSGKDVRGLTHEEGGIIIKMSNMFNAMRSGLSNEINSELHLVFNPKYENPNIFSGEIVLHSDASGTSATADIVILVDSEERWKTPEIITGDTIAPIPFEINISDIKTEVVIQTKCIPKGNGMVFALVNLNDE